MGRVKGSPSPLSFFRPRTYRKDSLRKHPFLLALRRWGRFARNVPIGEEEEKRMFSQATACRKGYYFYSPQSSTVIKSKMAATTTLRTRTRFRPLKIRLQ